MADLWQPGTYYPLGSVVIYEGAQYKIIQAHTSQSDWTPPVTPALWGRMQGSGNASNAGGCQGQVTQSNSGSCQGHSHQGNSGSCQGQSYQGNSGSCQKESYQGNLGSCQGQAYQGSSGSCQGQSYQSNSSSNSQGQSYQSNSGSYQGQSYSQSGECGQSASFKDKIFGRFSSDNDNNNNENKDESWLSEERKHQLEIGGGIVAATALVGGGIWAYSAHKNKEEEEKKASAWRNAQVSEQTYFQGAQVRSETYTSNSGMLPVYWVFVQNQQIPGNAIQCGSDSGGQPLYAARAYFKHGVHIGKAGKHLKNGVSIPWGGQEHNVEKFEILCGDASRVRWIDQEGDLNIEPSFQPVEGGRDHDGRAIFVAQVKYEGSVQVGKVVIGEPHCNLAYGGKEINHAGDWKVLAYN
ncbi:carbohydrate-binding module family 12 protein [Mixia osmundae IAM 14324]|uniref:Chitin-binding type-3 domain-containing protein n=1 Tax=Mixia osmundae (strain CBS 9802 / IAM 14324 / JCM 22182 / KY 12970) TaxID=764103 RepID=G7DW89_MIXOS|nr:carbohydrate-binding module family 12 protein [Mixia osmundae IAM 14324]KEI36524.1 carbohydrate-binding module family 12 protein [Mixia osmundae IAM 14324]GAA94777.1 hypothetical protein E5Q_01431 [Mixia osmundae IAM 14324]